MPFEQVRQKAVELGLVLTTAYQSHVPPVRREDEPAPIGPPQEILTDGCRWIDGETSGPDWQMCGHSTILGSVWCAHHHGRVFWAAPVSSKEAP